MERTAQDAYYEHVRNIQTLLSGLSEWRYQAANKTDADWGDVGDVTEVESELRHTLEFIKSIPQG